MIYCDFIPRWIIGYDLGLFKHGKIGDESTEYTDSVGSL